MNTIKLFFIQFISALFAVLKTIYILKNLTLYIIYQFRSTSTEFINTLKVGPLIKCFTPRRWETAAQRFLWSLISLTQVTGVSHCALVRLVFLKIYFSWSQAFDKSFNFMCFCGREIKYIWSILYWLERLLIYKCQFLLRHKISAL